MKIKYYNLLIIFAILGLSACGDDQASVEDFVKKVRSAPPGNIKKIPPLRIIQPYVYSAGNLRSPFDAVNRAAIQEVVQTENPEVKQQPRPDANRTRYYLEKYPLQDFIMVGTLAKENYNWGLIQDLNGMVHIVKVGDYIGQNSGKITEITPDEIKLIETVPDGSGGWMARKTEIIMKQD